MNTFQGIFLRKMLHYYDDVCGEPSMFFFTFYPSIMNYDQAICLNTVYFISHEKWFLLVRNCEWLTYSSVVECVAMAGVINCTLGSHIRSLASNYLFLSSSASVISIHGL